ncbi:MAG: hypothetical protein LDL50_06015 [Chloroflexi bacterium]|nr:hypothetical protein [Chloroflexota bacterium]MCA2001269.1 hypothetical protein [Chloroflexota bacterium]
MTEQSSESKVEIGGNIEGGTVIVGNHNTVNNILPQPKERDPKPLFGSIPARKTEEQYVRRGLEDEVRATLKQARAAVIVSGFGGMGKSELAKHIDENALWVNASGKNAAAILNELLQRCDLNLPDASDAQKLARLRELFLRQYPDSLVVLDDVRDAAVSPLLDDILALPCKFLLTSRRIQIKGIRSLTLDKMTPEQAFELMRRIVGDKLIRPEAETAQKIAERVKFNPLGLEICARWVWQQQHGLNPFAQFYKNTEKDFQKLKAEGDERWNLNFVFDVSYNDLDEADQKRFRQLAVFAPTGFSPQAAAAVWDMDISEAESALERFLNLSLIQAVKGTENRYRLHDLLDEYAALKLKEAGEEEAAQTALANWLIELFGKRYHVKTESIPVIAPEFDNLAKSCEWVLKNSKGALLALLATKPRNWLFNYFRQMSDWLRWLNGALPLLGENEKRLKADALQSIGDVQQFRDERDAALESYNEALKLFRQVGAKLGEANVLAALSRMMVSSGEIEKAEAQMAEIIQIRRALQDIYSEGADYGNFAIALLNSGRKQKAKEYALKARPIFEKIQLPAIVEMMDRVIAACEG